MVSVRSVTRKHILKTTELKMHKIIQHYDINFSLKLLPSTQDPINRPNSTIQSEIEGVLRQLVANSSASADDKKGMEGKLNKIN